MTVPRPTKQSLAEISNNVMPALSEVRLALGDTPAVQTLETFVAVALRIMAGTNTSKLREAMTTVAIQAYMPVLPASAVDSSSPTN